MMKAHHDHDDNNNPHLHRLLSSTEGGGGGYKNGPTYINNRRSMTMNNNISDTYHKIAAASSSPSSSLSRGSVIRNLQPFHLFASTTTTTSPSAPFNFPEDHKMVVAEAAAAAASIGYYAAPFTDAQWEELERQAMIYKYMVASIPVPLDLLFPNPFHNINNNPRIVNPFGEGGGVGGCGGGLKLRLSNSTDPEPGRCRRTDGKKWRCSRDAAAGHKYCERHMHRGRPRSRKPVEIYPNTRKAKTRHENHVLPSCSTTTTTISELNSNSNNGSSDQWQILGYNQNPLFLNKSPAFDSIPSSVPSHKEHRSLEWLTNEEDINEPINQIRNRDSASFLNQTPKDYIDAWSKTMADEQSSISLTLSMGDHAMVHHIHMGLNLSPVESIKEHNHHDQYLEGVGGNKSLISSWASPSSWAASSTPGGPLAEALRPSSTAASGDLSSPPITAISSPSAVLQKTVASVSDSGGSK